MLDLAQRQAADKRTDVERLLDDPPPGRSALTQRLAPEDLGVNVGLAPTPSAKQKRPNKFNTWDD